MTIIEHSPLPWRKEAQQLSYDWVELGMHIFNESWHGYLPVYEPGIEQPQQIEMEEAA